VADNYFYGEPTTQVINTYTLGMFEGSMMLVQNNIFHKQADAIIPDSANWGNVFAYNYSDHDIEPYYVIHGTGGGNLHEGNNGRGASEDTIHSTHVFDTYFRNHYDGDTHNPDIPPETSSGIALYADNRFMNVVGNVFGGPDWDTYQTDQAHGMSSVFETGWQGSGSGVTVANDPNVKRTLFRWGNWDLVSNAVRWCGNSGNTGWSTTCGSTTEVPSGIPNFPNPVPATVALPGSLYLSGKPSWFGSVPWPPIGPDVTGSTVTNTGGHAYKIPARLCFEAAKADAAYPSSNPRVLTFNAAACYQSGAVAPSPPSNLRIVP